MYGQKSLTFVFMREAETLQYLWNCSQEGSVNCWAGWCWILSQYL